MSTHNILNGKKTSPIREEVGDNNIVTNSSLKTDGNMIPRTPIKIENNFYLKGVFRIGGQRNFTIPIKNSNYFLVCNRFWNEGNLAAYITEEGINLLEVFTVRNDQEFLEKVHSNYFHIELSKMGKKSNNEVIGLMRLPLHQFFIAYRDATITNRLRFGQFPVFSTDAWVPIFNSFTGEKIGEVECLLAIGTEVQIENLTRSRGWKETGAILTKTEDLTEAYNNSQFNISHQISKDQISQKSVFKNIGSIKNETETMASNTKTNKTSDLLNILQKSVTIPSTTISWFQTMDQSTVNAQKTESFRIYLEIKCGKDLPLSAIPKVEKKLKRPTASKGRHTRFPVAEEPNTYVTFQAYDGHGVMVKSHEGMVFSTNVVEKASNPVWGKQFYVSVSLDYLLNKNEPFILKIWKKAGKNVSHSQPLPCPMEDSIIGFAAIDLTIFLSNVPTIAGWFNIMDFNGHINGQIKVAIQPLDNLQKLIDLVRCRREIHVDDLLDGFESNLNINNMNLSRAIKRKFTELEEISQRLRARLLDVTGNIESMSDVTEINDEQIDEFEHDLNTIASEDEHEIDIFTSHINCPPTNLKSANTQ